MAGDDGRTSIGRPTRCVDLAAVLALRAGGRGEGPTLREALALYERKGDLVQAGRVRDRLVGAPAA